MAGAAARAAAGAAAGVAVGRGSEVVGVMAAWGGAAGMGMAAVAVAMGAENGRGAVGCLRII